VEVPQSCQTCRFIIGINGSGICRRFPPQVQRVPATGFPAAYFPVVSFSDWCGEWRSSADKDQPEVNP